MDGVVANFIKAAHDAMGLDHFIPRTRVIWPDHMTEDDMWSAIHQHHCFWEDIEPYPWATRLYEGLLELDDVTFLTRPGRRAEAAAGKALWLEIHGFLKHNPHGVVFTMDKSHAASKFSLLIDDWDWHIREFQYRGGRGMLFKQPWNSLTNPLKPLTVEDYYKSQTTYVEYLLKDIAPFVPGRHTRLAGLPKT
jgi:hypothetical protein